MGNIVWLDVLRSKLTEQMAVGVGGKNKQAKPSVCLCNAA